MEAGGNAEVMRAGGRSDIKISDSSEALKGRKRDAPVGKVVGKAFGLATGSDVGEADFVGEGSDQSVAAGGEFGGDALFGGGETGEEEQASGIEGGLPVGWDAFGHGSRGAEDDGLPAAQEDAETFLLHGRMEAADDAPAFVAPACRLGRRPAGWHCRDSGRNRRARSWAERGCRDCRGRSPAVGHCGQAAHARAPDNGDLHAGWFQVAGSRSRMGVFSIQVRHRPEHELIE